MNDLKNEIKFFRYSKNLLNDFNRYIQIKSRKRAFRRIKRRNIFLFEKNKYNRIDKLFNNCDRSKFWSSVSKFKSQQNGITNLSDHKHEFINPFRDIFNDNYLKNEKQSDIENEVDHTLRQCSNSLLNNQLINSEATYFSTVDIQIALSRMNSSNTIGFDKLSTNMLKHGLCDRLATLTCI